MRVEGCARGCFACTLPNRCDLAECFAKASWLAGCSFVVLSREAEVAKLEIHRRMIVSERRPGKTIGMSPGTLARILGSYSTEGAQEQFGPVSLAQFPCNHLDLQG